MMQKLFLPGRLFEIGLFTMKRIRFFSISYYYPFSFPVFTMIFPPDALRKIIVKRIKWKGDYICLFFLLEYSPLIILLIFYDIMWN